MGVGEFLKRLFGGATSGAVPALAPKQQSGPGRLRQEQPFPSDAPSAGHGRSANRVADRYFELSAAIERAKANRDYRAAIAAARETYPLLADFVRHLKREYGRFDITTSHAVHTASTLMAVLEDRAGIRELRAALEPVSELRQWLGAADQAERDLELAARIVTAVQREPGLLQAELKERIGAEDGRRLALLSGWLEKAGRLRRVKKGSSHQLSLPGQALVASAAHAAPPRREGTAAPGPSRPTVPLTLRSRPRRPAALAQTIDIGRLPFLRLPKAPTRWEGRARDEAPPGGERPKGGRAASPFAAEGDGWQIVSEEKLAPAERPDPAYKDVFHTSGSTFWLDPKGHREGHEDAAAVLRATDRGGRVAAERGLGQDVYRSDVNTDGSAILFMSREGVLHGYSDRLDPLISEGIEDIPEYRAQAKRLGIDAHELRRHVRCVAISSDRSCYLVTVVDEAWCLSTGTGDVRWGLRMPTQEGWTRVVTPRTDRIGTSDDVAAALRLMELQLPATPEEVTHQYRRLALRWHPDRNPGDGSATRRFRDLVAAMELLTGADLTGIGAGESEEITYQKILTRERLNVVVKGVPGGSVGVEVTFSLGGSEKSAADWIYAANFAAGDNRVFLAGYSGKVVEVSERGTPVRVYDLGAVPRQIVHTDSYLYLLTDTRLYVVSEDRLDALVDVFDKGNLLVAETGFGLLELKAFSWFTPAGQRVGVVCTRDPIRRVLSPAEGTLLVETRQHRATVAGAPSWWRR